METTGIQNNEKTGKPDIIELAHINLNGHYMDMFTLTKLSKIELTKAVLTYASEGYSERFKPELNIHPEAYKIHGIRFTDLLKCRKHTEALNSIPKEMDYMIAHNASFDYRCIGKPEGVKLLCTQKLSKKLSKYAGKKFENHQLDTLVKHFYPEFPELLGKHHTALGDCVKTILVFIRLIEELPGIKTWDGLYQFQESVK